MARVQSTESSRVYVGMLILTCLAMAVGITVMVLEGGEYDWVQKPTATPAVQLPSNAPKPEAAVAVPQPAPAAVVVVEVPKPVVEAPKAVVEEPKVFTPPAAVAVEAPKLAEPAPLAAPSGPTPSSLIFPGR